jgi:transcriptional regulator with XRE-family HTH domain
MADTSTTIGEKLEEARKRRGISIREAAEATKVRGDYLLAMENNSFEINLPEIYIRGFLRIYVAFLRLDIEKFMADYDAARPTFRKGAKAHSTPAPRHDAPAAPVASTPSPAPQGGRTSFGRMEIAGASPDAAPQAQQMSFGPGEIPAGVGIPWLKPALIAVAVLVVLGIVGGLVYTFAGGSRGALNPELASSTSAALRPVTLVASDTVGVLVLRKSDGSRLYSGTLSAGQTQVVEAAGQVEVRFSNGRALMVERDGVRQRIAVDGTGRTILE